MRKRQTWIEPPQVSIRETDGAVCLDFSHERKHFLTPQAAYCLMKELAKIVASSTAEALSEGLNDAFVPDELLEAAEDVQKILEEPIQGVDLDEDGGNTNRPPVPGA